MVAETQLLMEKIGVVCREFNTRLFHSGPNGKINLGFVSVSAVLLFDHACVELKEKEG